MKTYVFTNRVYPPVGGATGELLKELAEGLAADGARVVVVTSRGAKDRWVKGPRDEGTKGLKDEGTKGLRGEGTETAEAVGDIASPALAGRGQLKGPEVVNGVEVIRVGTVAFTRASHWRRAWSYLSLYPQLMWQVWRLGRVEAVVSMTDPPLQVAAVTLASCRAGKKIHWAQDVYPELAEELGVIPRGGLLARLLRAVSTWALRRQDEIVVVGRCMRDRLIRRGVDAGKIEVIANWSPVGAVGAEAVAEMRERLGWKDKFVVLYSGNIGLAHDFDTIIGAARLLEGSGVEMVFAGEGPRLEQLRCDTAGLDHVRFLPPQPKDELGAFLAAADVHLVTVRAGLEGLVVPSKAYGILAAGRPMVHVGPAGSEMGRLLAETGAGVSVGNGESAKLAEVLQNLSRDGEEVRRRGNLAKKAADDYTFPAALRRWRELVEVG